MDKLNALLEDWFHGLRKNKKRFAFWLDRLGKGRRSLLLIILGLVPPMGYWIFFGQSHSWQQGTALILILVLGYGIAIVLSMGWYGAIAMEKAMAYGFNFKSPCPPYWDMEYFGFDPADRTNLELLMGRLPVGDRVNIRALGKNKGGSLRFLFTLLDLLLEGGIQDLDRDSRLSLSRLIRDNFSLNGVPINPNTIPSSYSKWNRMTRNGRYDVLRKAMARALGQS